MVWLTGICILILFLLFSKIYITVDYAFADNKQKGSIHISFLKVPIYKKYLQSDEKQHSILQILKSQNSISELLQEGKFLLKTLKLTSPSVYKLLQKLSVLHFNWHTNVGAGEASGTGMIVGGIWSIKGVIMAFLRQTTHVACSLHVNVIPYFQVKILDSKMDMKFSIRLGQAIVGGIRVLRSMSKHDEITISQ